MDEELKVDMKGGCSGNGGCVCNFYQYSGS